MEPRVGARSGSALVAGRRVRPYALLALVIALLATALELAAPRVPVAIGRFLYAEDPLEPAAAIVVLAGGAGNREAEAAALYAAGWAPRVILVKDRWSEQTYRRLLELGVTGALAESELRRSVLLAQGVPPSAITILEGPAVTTLDELGFALAALGDTDEPVIVVTSWFHTRRAGLYWRHLAPNGPRAVVRSQRFPAPAFDRWWRNQHVLVSVVQEYYGLADYLLGFRLGQQRPAARPPRRV